jgi:hypothetical protein
MLATSSHARIVYVLDSPPGFALSLHRAKAVHRARSIFRMKFSPRSLPTYGVGTPDQLYSLSEPLKMGSALEDMLGIRTNFSQGSPAGSGQVGLFGVLLRKI